MESLLKALAEQGVDASSMPEEQVLKVARAIGIDPDDHLPRAEVVVGPYTNKRKQTNNFVQTDAFVVGHDEKGKAIKVRGLFLRVEALDQAISDLQAARGLLASSEDDKE